MPTDDPQWHRLPTAGRVFAAVGGATLLTIGIGALGLIASNWHSLAGWPAAFVLVFVPPMGLLAVGGWRLLSAAVWAERLAVGIDAQGLHLADAPPRVAPWEAIGVVTAVGLIDIELRDLDGRRIRRISGLHRSEGLIQALIENLAAVRRPPSLPFATVRGRNGHWLLLAGLLPFVAAMVLHQAASGHVLGSVLVAVGVMLGFARENILARQPVRLELGTITIGRRVHSLSGARRIRVWLFKGDWMMAIEHPKQDVVLTIGGTTDPVAAFQALSAAAELRSTQSGSQHAHG